MKFLGRRHKVEEEEEKGLDLFEITEWESN